MLGMDIPRPFAARRRKIRHTLYLLSVIISIAAISAGLSRLEPAAPRVDRSTLWMGEVKRGDLTRRVRGLGKLIPKVIRWIPAATQGRVERVLIQPGERVIPETVLLELSSPELEQQALDAESQLKRAEAELGHLRTQLESEKMKRQADAARVESEYLEATLKAEADAALLREGLVSEMDTKISRSKAETLETQRLLEKKRTDIFSKSLEAQLEAKEAEVEQRRLLHSLRRSQLESLRVRPGISGVLQQVEVEVGQQVTPGTNLVRIAEPSRLKAEIEVVATQARDLEVGQKAEIDTRNGVVPGRLSRIDPAVKAGAGDRGRGAGGKTAPGGPPGPERGRNRGVGTSGGRALHAAARVQPGGRLGQALPDRAGRNSCPAGPRRPGSQLGRRDSSSGGAEFGRSSRTLRHGAMEGS